MKRTNLSALDAIKNLGLIVILLLVTITTFAQVSGTVSDETGPMSGVNVIVQGTDNGTTTDFDGNFIIKNAKDGVLVLTYIGYTTKNVNFKTGNNLTITMAGDGETLDEIVISGVIDIAKDRQTPVAVSTIKSAEIIERLGSQEFPEILNNTPSVYATKSGGGFGDARINIRGFSQENIAVMINGVPVNDMENGRVFWSNWAGLSDVTTAMQVQRGLGSSKLAISSVGGTINIVTKTTDKKQGGVVSSSFGNDNYLKTLATYSTGKMDNGFAASVLLSRTAGDGYIDGTEFEGYNYFISFGLDKGAHNFQFTITGAPQAHNQRTTSFFNMATLADYQKLGYKYNYNNGSLNGEEFNWRKNFYHKPITFLNWDWKLNEKSKISTSAYASFGRGGGTGDIGRLGGKFASSSEFRDSNTGEILWDEIVASNSGQGGNFNEGFTFNNTPDFQTGTFLVNDADLYSGSNPNANPEDRLDGVSRRNGAIRRASVNSHNWYGLLANFNHKLSENLTMDAGIDLRSYKGFHYRRIDNLLGADGYRDNNNVNNRFNVLTTEYSSNLNNLWNVFSDIDDEEKIDYYNVGLVRWYGAFGQLEYTKEKVSAFLQFGASQQGFKRIDYFNQLDTDPNQETDWENILGGNVKGGLNYNLTEKHNVFANAGYYSKQPFFDAIFLNNRNNINENYENEKITGFELGYGYRTDKVKVNVNLYRTSWKDRFIRVTNNFDVNLTPNNDDDDIEGFANVLGVEQVHIGVEFDFDWKPTESLRILGMMSSGNWEYGSTVSATYFDDSQNLITYANGDVPEETLYLEGVKVGNAAQFTARLGLEYEAFKNLKFDLSQRYIDKLYARINAADFNSEDHNGSLKLPGYALMDAGVSYKLNLENSSFINFRLNINNLANTDYIAESATNYFPGDRGNDETYLGINTSNKVFFGFGRTWNASVRFNF
ncbi:MAG: TonB-dependent receptor [Flavobacteriaceae bacterium]|nr:TonB-dependent receptor [Flavobacteriaceae bacterium]